MRLSSDPAARRRLFLLIAAAAAALVVGVVVGAGDEQNSQPARSGSRPPTAPVDRLSLRQQVGQLTISTFPNRTVPGYIRRRLRARETAGVILFGTNAGGPGEWRRLTRSLQRAARGAALVMVDQEGGDVRTLSWAGPAAAQALQGDPASVRREAAELGSQLRAAGVNVDLAPVADLPGGQAIGSRAFAGDADGVAARVRASVAGLDSARVAATAKHFPGFGRAALNTDDGSVTIDGGVDQDLVPFRAAIDAGVPLVMLSHALYPALDPHRIASQSARVATGLLRHRLGFGGVVVTDSIEAQAVLDRSGVATAAQRSIAAGADLILTTGSASWNAIEPRLLAEARRSRDFRQRVRRSAARVLALKRRLGLSAR
jgi:beta-N-acetylhexosaminidase